MFVGTHAGGYALSEEDRPAREEFAKMTPETGPYTEHHETHIGVVMMVGERAYKMKKPVDLGFVDFTSREQRLAACWREVELNRRLAPDVYLDVADVIGSGGKPCEHLVVMRRMPDRRRLSTLVGAGAPVGGHLQRLARLLASFHDQAARDSEIRQEGSRDAVRTRWLDNLEQVRRTCATALDAAAVDEVERLALRFLAGREALFAARIEADRIIDGHGDLLADDVFCLDDGPRALDCLDFDDRLRWIDAIDDAACLAMDLERLSAPDLARDFLACYVESAGDPAAASLIHHYIAYRACVRVKVACLRHETGDPDAAEEGRRLLAITKEHLRAGAVTLTLVGGPPGSGKTTLATGLAERLGCSYISSDQVRKELAGLSPDEDAAAASGEGIYTPEWTQHTYAEVLTRAKRQLELGKSVILDASWARTGHRGQAAETAQHAEADMISLRCAAPADVSRQRLGARNHGASDATEDIAATMAAQADPWPEATPIDTGESPRESLDQAAAVIHDGTPDER